MAAVKWREGTLNISLDFLPLLFVINYIVLYTLYILKTEGFTTKNYCNVISKI